MGSYGIGIERILSAAIELYYDKDGIVLRRDRSLPGSDHAANNSDAPRWKPRATSTRLSRAGPGRAAGRPRRASGVKFKDAD